jgi:hypothetical protein
MEFSPIPNGSIGMKSLLADAALSKPSNQLCDRIFPNAD